METIIFTIVLILAASIIHATAGFGFSIITMIFFPLYFSVPESIVLKTMSGLVVVVSIVIRYRKEINYKLLFWPLLLAIPGASYGVVGVTSMDNALAMKVLGISLIGLSVYFYFLSDKLQIPANKWTAMIGGGFSGLMGGFLGVPGPPIVLYYSVVMKRKEVYMATIQTFFLSIDIICLIFLTKELQFTTQTITVLPVAFVTAIVGMMVGNAVFRRMSAVILHKIIYGLMLLSGIYYLI